MPKSSAPVITLGQRIKLAREEAGLSQRQLGQILQLSDKAVSSYEVGRAEPSLEILQTISRATSTPVEYFFSSKSGADSSSNGLLLAKLARIEKELQQIKQSLKKS